MASLIENLITGLNQEYAVYEKLLEVSMEKTTAIISNNLDRLRETTDNEQLLVDNITSLEKTRRANMSEIAEVLGRRGADIKISEIADFLKGQPQFYEPLVEINEKLAALVKKLRDVNDHNGNLINDSLEMIQYNINLLQNINRAPETAEYSKDMFKGQGAYSGDVASPSGKFDAKQ